MPLCRPRPTPPSNTRSAHCQERNDCSEYDCDVSRGCWGRSARRLVVLPLPAREWRQDVVGAQSGSHRTHPFQGRASPTSSAGQGPHGIRGGSAAPTPALFGAGRAGRHLRTLPGDLLRTLLARPCDGRVPVRHAPRQRRRQPHQRPRRCVRGVRGGPHMKHIAVLPSASAGTPVVSSG